MQVVSIQTICMKSKCHNLFSVRYKKNISKCHLLKFLSSLQSIKFISMIMSIDGRAELFGHNIVT